MFLGIALSFVYLLFRCFWAKITFDLKENIADAAYAATYVQMFADIRKQIQTGKRIDSVRRMKLLEAFVEVTFFPIHKGTFHHNFTCLRPTTYLRRYVNMK